MIRFPETVPGALGRLAMPDFMAPAGDPYIAEQIGAFTTQLAEITGIEQPYEDVYDRELRFFNKVYDVVMRMSMGHNKKVRVYPDIDQTLVEGLGQGLVVRPAFPWVAARLYEDLGDRLQVGALTTLKNHSSMYDVLFADVKPDIIDPNSLLCTREYNFSPKQAGLLNGEDNDAARLQNIEHLIDPVLVAATKRGLLQLQYWHDPDGKLEILDDQLKKAEHTGDRLVFIDNLPTAYALRSNDPRFRAICVANEVQNDFFRMANRAGLERLEAARLAYAA